MSFRGMRLVGTVVLAGLVLACGGGESAVGSDSTAPTTPGGGSNPNTGGNGSPEVTFGPSGNVNSPEGGLIGSVTRPLTQQQFDHQFSAPPGRPTVPSNTIAYRVQTEDAHSIRLVSGDGDNDREILSVPNAPVLQPSPNSLFERVVFDELAWRPDGTEIAFVSNFEIGVRRSEIYAATVDGSNLRRLTGVPRPIAYPNYPQGTVQRTVLHPELNGGVSVAYFEGDPQGIGWLLGSQERRIVNATTADLGAGISQQSVLMSAGLCYYDLAANADVVAGQNIVVQQVLPQSLLSFGFPCPVRYSPQWLSNDQLTYFERRHLGPRSGVSFSPAFSLLRAPVDNLSPTTVGAQIERYTQLDPGRDILNPVVEGKDSEFLFYRQRPDNGSDEFVVVSQVNSELTVNEDKIHWGRLSAPATGNLVRLTICPETPGCDIADARWIPGTSAFVYTSREAENRSSLRIFNVAGESTPQDVLVQIADGKLGAMSVSPDGARIVVERLGIGSPTIELWMYNRDSRSFEQFIANGAAPAWR